MNFCRICTQEIAGPMIKLFHNNEESKELVNKIFLCTRVFLCHQKNYPSNICTICLEELNIAHNFRIKCINSEKMLLEVFNYNLPGVKEENLAGDTKDSGDHKADTYPYEDAYNFVQNTGEESKTQIDLKPNIIYQDEFKNTKFRCDTCNKVLKTEVSLVRHKVTMHQNRKHVGHVTGFGVTRLYHCTKCSYSTPHSQTLVNHDRKHTGERPYHCYCGKSFTQSSSLVAHCKTHSDETNFTCSECGKQFKHSFSLKKHTKVHEEGTFSCEICKKILKTKDSLKHHLRRHYNVKEFNCEQCGDTFVTQSELINHRKKHKIEKTIECNLCGFKTHTKKVLILHLKRHTGDKSYKCDLCEMSCYTMGDLRTHSRVHTREKPYQCPTCLQRFMHSSSLNKHMQNVHGINYKWRDIKDKKSSIYLEIKD